MKPNVDQNESNVTQTHQRFENAMPHCLTATDPDSGDLRAFSLYSHEQSLRRGPSITSDGGRLSVRIGL